MVDQEPVRKRGLRTAKIAFLRKLDHHGTEETNSRGRKNEARALSLLREMVDEGVFCRVKKASKKQNKSGIDLFGTVILSTDRLIPDEVQVPFQVKSSLIGKSRFENDPKKPEVIVLVISSYSTNKQLKGTIRQEVERYLLLREPNP